MNASETTINYNEWMLQKTKTIIKKYISNSPIINDLVICVIVAKILISIPLQFRILHNVI